MGQVERVCDSCGQSFKVVASRANTARHCSKACQQQQVEKACAWCDILFSVKQSQAVLRRCCSRSCAAKLRIAEGRSRGQDRPRDAEERGRIAEALRGYYRQKPERHPNWRGGAFTQKRGANWPEQRQLARERDNYTCQDCGVAETELGKELSVHHKTPFRQFATAEEANQLDNLVSLCPPCHWKADHQQGVHRARHSVATASANSHS